MLEFSRDYKYVTVAFSYEGNCWFDIGIVEIATKKMLSDRIKWVRFSGTPWVDDGFYYSCYSKLTAGDAQEVENHSIYYHKVGSAQIEDQLIYEDKQNPKTLNYLFITEDQKYIIRYSRTNTNGCTVYYKKNNQKEEYRCLLVNSKYNHWVITNINDRFLIYTTENAPNGNVVLANIDSTQKNNWKIVIPESDMPIHNVSVGGRKLFVQYIKDSRMHCFQYSYDGILEHEITLPGTGSIDGFWGKESESNIFYTFQSFFHPESIWKYNIKTGISKVVHIPSNAPNPITYQETKITYGSKDGTKIPMLILHKKGQQTSNNICWLEGYGGFNASLLPKFNPSFILFIDQGGVIALPSLRRGGEYGKNWHEAGTLHKKQNVFDDFIAASEYMIHSGYTSTEKLIISGVCNGGLLVSACANQRPDLYAVVITDMGIMDMIRYQNFSIGNLWISEYGTSDDPSYFRVLYAYSPLHNIKNIDYPSIMVRTSDNDGRVPPLHSFKYVAQLQKTYQGLNPILLRVYSQSGHGCHLAIQKKIDKMSDFFAFAFYNTKTNWKV